MNNYTFTGNYIRGLDEWLNHDPREDVKPVCFCTECKEGIYDGETIYKIKNDIWCEKCMDSFRTYASEDM